MCARDLGLRERILRDVARALRGELGVRRLLELDLDLREPALELLAIALGAVVLLLEPIAIGLGLLELDANLAHVVRELGDVIALAAAPAVGLALDQQPAHALVLFLEGDDLRPPGARPWSRLRRARP